MKPQRPASSARRFLPWLLPAVAVAILGGFLAGQQVGSRSGGSAPASAPLASGADGAAGVDIASMSPEERASRLYDRVMRYGEAGRLDSARFFAPMALQAYAALGPADAHTHYDIGMIWAVVGDSARARTEARLILDTRSTHLLGLLLAMRSAGNASERASFTRRFVNASASELASPLPEYIEHRHDIDGALSAAKAPSK